MMQAKNFISVQFNETNWLIFETAHTCQTECLSAIKVVIEVAIFMLEHLFVSVAVLKSCCLTLATYDCSF